MLERSVDAFLAHPAIDEIVVALPAELAPIRRRILRGTAKPVRIVAGGARRQDSVANAFQRGRARGRDVVVIHDAARPFASARPDRAHDCRRGRIAARRSRRCRRATRSSAPVRRTDGAGESRDRRPKRCRASRSISRRRRRRSAATCCATRWRSASATASTRPTRRRSPSAPGMPVRARRRRGDEHQDHDAGGSDVAEAIAPPSRPADAGADRPRRHRLRPAPAGRRAAADPRRRHDSVRARARSATPTPTSCATR